MDLQTVTIGGLAGMIHHVSFQYPRQVPPVTTLVGFLLFEITLGGFVISQRETVRNSLASFAVVSVAYVVFHRGSLIKDYFGSCLQNDLQHLFSSSGNPRQGLDVR
jgi:hypothetical protein